MTQYNKSFLLLFFKKEVLHYNNKINREIALIHIPVTLFTSGVLGILCVVLSFSVSLARKKTKVSLGDGAGAAETGALLHAVRAHGNFIENVPLALILLGGIEASGASHVTCELFAAVLIIGRLLHAIGIRLPGSNFPRAGGAILTLAVLLGLGIEALSLV